MKVGFYPKLAADSIRKNKKMFTPFIMTCVGMVMMFYIIMYIGLCSVPDSMMGAESVRSMLQLGSVVIAVFACIFLFYTNSFLMRRRKKEFGLYNILGMGKWSIARILFWETLTVAAVSILAGLLFGISFSKLAELGFINIMNGEITYDLNISWGAVARTLEVFGVIFLLLLLNSIRQVRFSSAVQLLRGESTGEKPPRANWLFGILGAVVLVGAYYIAVTIKDPITALLWFFVAVLMVIAGTYLLMISGSVMFCRLLQKNKSYYYKPNHFVSVSSMAFRMKRNGAGLASICILATMVLVMISSTTCLYFGEENAVNQRYPRDINIDFRFGGIGGLSDDIAEAVRRDIDGMVAEAGASAGDVISYRTAAVSGYMTDDGNVELDVRKIDDRGVDVMANVFQFLFVPLSDFNETVGDDISLGNDEALICVYRHDFDGDVLSFNGGRSFHVKKYDEKKFEHGEGYIISPCMVVVVPDLEYAVEGIADMTDSLGEGMLQYRMKYDFDTELDVDEEIALCDTINEILYSTPLDASYMEAKYGAYASIASREENRQDFYGMFGTLFYIGIILSIVFTLAAVLIIYYKQLSEGYEDQARFGIMQKVGMTKRDIKKSINSQLLTVFFLPLLFAAMHLAFAFPIIHKLLLLFGLDKVTLFAATTGVSLLVFAVFYTIVYKLTAGAYYKIVSGTKEEF